MYASLSEAWGGKVTGREFKVTGVSPEAHRGLTVLGRLQTGSGL